MALAIKKEKNGRIVGMIEGDPDLVLTKKGIKVIDGMSIKITHFMNPQKKSIYWVCDSIQTNILGRSDLVKDGKIEYGNGRLTQIKVRYLKPVILAIHDWDAQSARPQFLDHMGNHLSGTNIHGDAGNSAQSLVLCLGDNYNMFSINLVDGLLYSKANRDLSWQGPPILGKSQLIKGDAVKKIKIFNVEEWSKIKKCTQIIPNEILGYANALLK